MVTDSDVLGSKLNTHRHTYTFTDIDNHRLRTAVGLCIETDKNALIAANLYTRSPNAAPKRRTGIGLRATSRERWTYSLLSLLAGLDWLDGEGVTGGERNQFAMRLGGSIARAN